MLKIVTGVQAAAGHEHIGGADRCGAPKSYLNIVIIILLKEGIGKDAEDVPAVVVPVFRYELGSDLFQLVGQALCTGHAEAVFQCGGNGGFVFVPIFPKIKTAGIFPAARIGNIENIFEPRIVAAGVDQRNALGTTADISAHLLVPQVVVGAGRGVGLLSEDHKLFVEGVLVEPSRRFQKSRPLAKAAGDLPCGVVSHLCVER